MKPGLDGNLKATFYPEYRDLYSICPKPDTDIPNKIVHPTRTKLSLGQAE
jgi:hypothetical protein